MHVFRIVLCSFASCNARGGSDGPAGPAMAGPPFVLCHFNWEVWKIISTSHAFAFERKSIIHNRSGT